jgi:hypothetical protein
MEEEHLGIEKREAEASCEFVTEMLESQWIPAWVPERRER